jgi:hypothetical protein
MSPYLKTIIGYMQRTGCGLTASQCERLFGAPPGASAEALFQAAVDSGHLRTERRSGRVVYYFSGVRPAKEAPREFAGIGRDGPAVASVWQFASQA